MTEWNIFRKATKLDYPISKLADEQRVFMGQAETSQRVRGIWSPVFVRVVKISSRVRAQLDAMTLG